MEPIFMARLIFDAMCPKRDAKILARSKGAFELCYAPESNDDNRRRAYREVA